MFFRIIEQHFAT